MKREKKTLCIHLTRWRFGDFLCESDLLLELKYTPHYPSLMERFECLKSLEIRTIGSKRNMVRGKTTSVIRHENTLPGQKKSYYQKINK